MTIEDIRALVAVHESFPHNLNVAEALFRMTYLENWGSGAKRIIDACRAQNVEEPTWSDNGGFITVTFKRPSKSSLEGHVPQNDNDVLQNGQRTQESTQEKYSGTQEKHSSTQETALSTQEKILMMLKSEPTLTTSEVAHRLGTTRDGIRKILDKLRQDGRLVREGSTKSGKWIVTNKD